MTREDAKNSVLNYALGMKINNGINSMENLINKIFDEHEAQMKAKDEEIERLNEDIECAKNVIKELNEWSNYVT